MEIRGIEQIYMIGDLHFGIRSNSLAWKDAQFAFMNQFIDELSLYGFNAETSILMFTGDIFHSREFLNVYILRQVIDLFKRLSDIFKRGIYIILGNHDEYNLKTRGVNSVQLLDELLENVHVFTDAGELNIVGPDNMEYDFLMLPWQYDQAAILNSLQSHYETSEYVFAHMDIDEFKYNKVVNIDGGIPVDALRSYKRIYSGHIHAKQEKHNVLYLGAPYQMDRGDMNTERGYYVMRLIDGEILETFVPNIMSPKFVEIECEEMLSMSEKQLAALMGNNYVDVHVPRRIMRAFPFTRLEDYMKESNIAPQKIEFKPTEETELTTISDGNTGNSMGVFEAGEEFLRHREYTPIEITKIMTCFTKYYESAKNKTV